jgi:hypothetical protein
VVSNRQQLIALAAVLFSPACGGELYEPSRCLARHSAFVHFQFDEDMGLPYTLDLKTSDGDVTLVCEQYSTEDPYGGATIVESNVESIEAGSNGGFCTSDRLSVTRWAEIYDITFEVRSLSRVGSGSDVPVYRLRQAECHEVLDGEVFVSTQQIDDV